MASNINTTDIDAEYPVAGQDNDSQGFRDNFSTIKESLVAAKSEIEALQDNTAKVNEDNDFSQNVIKNAGLENVWQETNKLGGVNNNLVISFADGGFHSFSTAENISVQFTGWPTEEGKYARIRVDMRANPGLTRTVTFGGATIFYSDRARTEMSNGSFSVTEAPKIVDVWTSNANGSILYIDYVGEFATV